jgi:hypothetical protein
MSQARAVKHLDHGGSPGHSAPDRSTALKLADRRQEGQFATGGDTELHQRAPGVLGWNVERLERRLSMRRPTPTADRQNGDDDRRDSASSRTERRRWCERFQACRALRQEGEQSIPDP